MRKVGSFLYLWLMVGFFTGTVLLVGPVTWITGALRRASAGEAAENAVMIGVILAFVAGSFALTLWLMRRARASERRWLRAGVPVAATAAAGLALWGWSNPARYVRGAAAETQGHYAMASGVEFAFGAYPDRDRLARLKAEGFTGVVSLQHPAVVPFEPSGIAAERDAAREVGIRFIHAPMVPWVSDNAESLERIRALARSGEGRYYVHCGLGRDRTNVVRRMLERMGARTVGNDVPEPRTFAARLADNRPPFERGQIREIDRDVWLIPYPNEHELYANMLSGQVAHVLLLLDPAQPEQATWLAQARATFGAFDVAYSERPHPTTASAAETSALVAHARTLARPLAIVVPYTQPRGDATVAVALMRAWGVDPFDYPPPVEEDHGDSKPAVAASSAP